MSGVRERISYYLHSGDKRHVAAGLAVITAAFGIPYYIMTTGKKQLSHQDYLEKSEKADQARAARLSSSSPPPPK